MARELYGSQQNKLSQDLSVYCASWILSYCDTCFCPLGSTNRKSLESLQRRAAKIVYGFKPDITIGTILENQRWPPLTKTMEKHRVLLTNAWLEKFLYTLKTTLCYAARVTVNSFLIDALDLQLLTLYFPNVI